MSSNDGGPAFPVVAIGPLRGSRIDAGMSLRDYFAGQALAGIMASCHEMLVHDAARWAWEQADAMLAQRLINPQSAVEAQQISAGVKP